VDIQRNMQAVWSALALVCLFGGKAALADPALERLRRPQNAAISVPAGQGLDLLHSAEPLGPGRFRLRAMNRSQSISLPEIGEGGAFTGTYSLAYALTPSLETSLVVPFLMDSAGGLNKYGTGDVAAGFKLSRPARLPANFYTAYQLLIGIPLGYKGEHALDKVGGMRPFSTESVDLGLQVLIDMHFSHASFYLNGGYFRSGNADILPQLVYGVGLEVGRKSRWASFNAEYQARVAFTQESRASGILKIGTRVHIFRGMELELNREFGFIDHPSRSIFTFGLRLHGRLTPQRRLEGRHALYQPPPPPKRLYQPAQVVRIAIVDFGGFEEYEAGEKLVEKIKTLLEPHDSLEVVDLSRYAGIPHKVFLKPREALELARKLGVDVVLTGTVSAYEIDRFAGLQVPYVVHLPEAKVEVKLRYRVVEFSPDKTQMQVFSEEVAGQGRLRKGVRLLSTDRRNITARASAGELHLVQDQALSDLAGNMLAMMAAKISWVPPDFLP